MTPEEIAAKLKELGIKTDAWQESPAGKRKSPLIEQQKEALKKVRDLLQQQVQADQVKLAELHETLNRVKHGGGS